MCDYLGLLFTAPTWIFSNVIVDYMQYSIAYINTSQFFYPLLEENETHHIVYGDNQV